MTVTHVSHFGLTELARTSDSIIFCGTMADCKRMAFSHGMEVKSYTGSILSVDSGIAHYAMADALNFSNCEMKNGGMIQRTQDGYALVMPLSVWEND